jgi:DNA-binding CsgD family transcriptional regulator
MSTLASLLFSRGYSLLLEGNYERAAALCEEAEVLFRERGYKGHLEFVLDNLGWAALLGGDHERAKAYYEENLVVCKELGDKMIASESLEGLACVAGTRGEAEQAARLFGAAEALREAVGFQHTPEEDALREPYLAAASSQLYEAAWEAAFAEGRTMAFEEAVEYALSEEEPSTATLSSSRSEHPAGLTSREIEVLGLVAAGMTSAQIAKELFLSPRTVEAHLASIYHKLGVTSRAGATRFALEPGLA